MIKKFEFESGLKLFYNKSNLNKLTTIRICFDCGSQCDGDKPGLAHFCEHMFFTGTKSQNKQEITKEYFDFIGTNAYTSDCRVSFWGSVFNDELEKYIKTVCKLITNSTFSQKAVEAEQQVVLQEIASKSDRFDIKSIEEHKYLVHKKEYYLNRILGNEKSIKSITSKDVKDFVKKYFVTNGCYIYVTTPLSFNKIKRIIENTINSTLKCNKNYKSLPYLEEDTTYKSELKLVHKNIDKNYVRCSFVVPEPFTDINKIVPSWLLTDYMSNISSGLMKVLRIEKSLVYKSGFYCVGGKKMTEFCFTTETQKENIKECLKVLADYINELKKNGLDQNIFNQIKRENRHNYESYLPSPQDEISMLIDYRQFGEFISTEKSFAIGQKVKKEALENALHRYFDKPIFKCLIYGDATKQNVPTTKELQDMFK